MDGEAYVFLWLLGVAGADFKQELWTQEHMVLSFRFFTLQMTPGD